jgi:hypothetical protein
LVRIVRLSRFVIFAANDQDVVIVGAGWRCCRLEAHVVVWVRCIPQQDLRDAPATHAGTDDEGAIRGLLRVNRDAIVHRCVRGNDDRASRNDTLIGFNSVATSP